MVELDNFLLGQQIEGAVLLHGLELLEPADAAADGAEVGEHTAQPPGVDVMNAGAGRFIADGILRLLLGAHKKHGFAVGRQIAHEHIRFLQLADRFLQVDDINAVALRKNIRGHFGVPAAGLVSEVDAGLQQLLHGYDCHNAKSSLVFPPQVLEEQQIYPSIRGNRRPAAPAAAKHLRAFCRNSIP